MTVPLVQAETDGMYELSGRLNIVGASGRPSNDILGFGVVLHRKLSDEWYLGFGLDNATDFDVERPNERVDIDSVKETDALGTMNMISVVAERRYALDSEGWTGFWNLGGGVADIDVDDADGDVKGGGTFDIEIDVDTEYLLIGSVGAMQRLGEHWSARYEATMEQHFANWDIKDKVTGRTDSYSDYTVYGLRIGLNYRF
ncbi:MAG: hypothetical protein KJN95_07365 [Gammaproteobacteria bacterium]|nr:hypothetical protein [Gammaproteobacteria bacterium]